jgi:hypothetical protein
MVKEGKRYNLPGNTRKEIWTLYSENRINIRRYNNL